MEANKRSKTAAGSPEVTARIEKVRRRVASLAGLIATVAICFDRMQAYTTALAEGDGAIIQPIHSEAPPARSEPLPPVSPSASPAASSSGAASPDMQRFDMSLGIPRQPVEPRSLEDKEIRPLGELETEDFVSIHNKSEACRRFEGKLIAFYDQTALIQKCKMRLIEDPLLLNAVRKQNEGKIQDVPASVYRLFPEGAPIRESDIKGIERMLGFAEIAGDCNKMSGEYVTVSGTTFYYIENCKKRRFKSYAALEEHNRSKRTVLAVTPSQLAAFADGKDMTNEGEDISDVWVQIDGDAGWQRAARIDADKPKSADSPERLREIAKQQRDPVKSKVLCVEIGGKIVSFYHQLYFVENCALRLIQDKDQLKLQVRLEGREKVRDLSANEKRAMKDGRSISVDDVLARMAR